MADEFSDLQGIPGVTRTAMALVGRIRSMTRDKPELNRLIGGKESSDRDILWALMDTVSTINLTPHPTSYSLEEMVQKNTTPLLIDMTIIRLLEGVGLLQTRNHVSYSAGGQSLGVNDKTPLLQMWLKYYHSKTDQLLARVKVSWNLLSILGADQAGVPSEYWAIHQNYSLW
jgi:hypothetical protein